MDQHTYKQAFSRIELSQTASDKIITKVNSAKTHRPLRLSIVLVAIMIFGRYDSICSRLF